MATWEPPNPVNRPIIFCGGSAIGRRIACTWISAGFNVHIHETDVYDRATALQYVVANVGSYRQKIGSLKQGIITASDELDSPSSFNPWLVIEAIPDLMTDEETLKFKTRVLYDLDEELPYDCILSLNSMRDEIILQKVKRKYRVLILHHYLIPNVRVIEMVKIQQTENAVVEFLFKMIPATGALSILAKDGPSAGVFQKVWIAMKKEVCGTSNDLIPLEIDDGWHSCLQVSSAEEMYDWFECLRRDIGELLESSYVKGEQYDRTILLHLRDVLTSEGEVAPYDGRKLEPVKLTRAGPNIFFIDIGHLESSTAKCGRILCSCIDGTIREIVSKLRLPYGLAIHFASKRIYWTDLADGTISSCSYNGTKTRIIVPRDSEPAPKQIAVDQTNSQIYWTQSEGTSILRCNYDGTHIERILEIESGSSPNGITLDPSRRHFYWSRPSLKDPDKHQIQRASMDLLSGSSPSSRDDTETLFENLPQVQDIDFVPVYDEIYWSIKNGRTTQIHCGYLGPCPDYGMDKQNVVVKDLRGLGWLKVDPKSGHFYTTCVIGALSRYNMTTGEGEFRMYNDENAAFAGIALMYGDLDWKQEGSDSAASDENGNEGKREFKSAKGKIIGMDGATDLNSESTGTLSAVSSEEGSTRIEEPASDDLNEAAKETGDD